MSQDVLQCVMPFLLDPAKGITHCKFIAINWQDGMIGLGGFCLNSF